MSKPSDSWDNLREQILGLGQQSTRKSYYPALRRRIAELENIEAELRESREQLELALGGAEMSMWDWDLVTGQVHFSDSWWGILGYESRSGSSSMEDWRDLLHPEDRDRAVGDALNHIKGLTPAINSEFRLRHQDGHWVWFHSKGKVLARDENGQALRACGTHLDITRRKEAEQESKRLESQVQHAQKLESLGVLAGGIAHDFNNLLVAILGNAELAAMELPPGSGQEEYLGEIVTAARRASELTNQMLAYSGKGRFVVKSLDLNQAVKEMGRLLEVSIPKKVMLRYNLATSLPLIEADATQIRQVVMNLVTNAADAMAETSGVLTLTTSLKDVDAACLTDSYLNDHLPGGLYVTLEVTDTGCGMDSATRQRLFDPFFTTKTKGRGLGMAAVLGIVRGHKGTIMVDSEPGRGSTFTVMIPASELLEGQDGAQDPAWAAGEQRKNEGLTVLVVDDEESVRNLTAIMLKRLGFQVLTAPDGQEGLAVFEAHRGEIGLVVLDLTMPRLDGKETFHQMRQLDPSVRVVLSSGYSECEAETHFGDKGLKGFVQKPYTLAEFSDVVLHALD